MHFTAFQNYIIRWYKLYGRHDLPWRQTNDLYAILVSELMLQQTQVERVRPKYIAFLEQFPNVMTLANAKLSDVLIAWQGLGYNRRAKYLWQTAQLVEASGGSFPLTVQELQTLPGIGPYTAAAVACFSYNLPLELIETNVRTVFLYHFFPGTTNVSDDNLLPLIKASLDTENPREWNWALMDYGSYLKTALPNPSRQSKQYNKQSAFTGSKRQMRGEILRLLSKKISMTKQTLQQQLISNAGHFDVALESLVVEEMVHEKDGQYRIGKDSP